MSGGLAGLAGLLGWPREQVLITGILAATVLLWLTEILPLFSTAFISMMAQILLLGNPGGWSWLGFQTSGGPTARQFLSAAVDPVLLLFFAGLILARAITNTGVDRGLAAVLLQPMAGTPGRLLLGVMLTTSAFSLVISNTATTALMLTLVVPILRQLPPSDPFRKALILAVPASANVAGMTTPISSPPNAIAMSYMSQGGTPFSFGAWIAVAAPIVIVLLSAAWWRLRQCYPSNGSTWRLEFPDATLTGRGVWVVGVVVFTFVVWLSEPWHGIPAAAAAMLPVALLLATLTISRQDVNSLDWDVLILIAGGLTLGFSLHATGLDQKFAAVVPEGAGPIAALSLLGFSTFVLGTFFSNTASASMLMPVAAAVAAMGAPGVDLTSATLTVALAASMGMALPVSTPPNAMAHATGELTTRDFVRIQGYIGLLGTILVVLVLALARK